MPRHKATQMLDYDINGEPLYIVNPISCLDAPERPGHK
jgi:hypothetical protein